MQKGFEIDLNRCTGCQACVLACAIENELPMNSLWRTVYTFNEPRHPQLPVYHLSLACNHCDDPACSSGCPTRAYTKDEVTGAVVLDARRCIGCKYCTWMCPYDAPRFDSSAGIVRKCTLCNHRLDKGLEPACVTCCPTGAIKLCDVDLSRNSFPPGFAESAMGPAVEFVPLRDTARMADLASPPEPPESRSQSEPMRKTLSGKVSLRREWTLLVFTLLAPLLVAWFTAGLFGATYVNLPVYAVAGGAALALTLIHLSVKRRACLATLNWRRSWLSREILLFALHMCLSTVYLIGVGPADSLGLAMVGWSAGVIGALALLSMDMVYSAAATSRPTRVHSASVLLTGVLFTGILAKASVLAVPVICAKALLYIHRKLEKRTVENHAWLPASAVSRIGIGFVAPLVIWFVDIPMAVVAMCVCCMVGELMDRGEFYDEFEVTSPQAQIARDLHVNLRRLTGGVS